MQFQKWLISKCSARAIAFSPLYPSSWSGFLIILQEDLATFSVLPYGQLLSVFPLLETCGESILKRFFLSYTHHSQRINVDRHTQEEFSSRLVYHLLAVLGAALQTCKGCVHCPWGGARDIVDSGSRARSVFWCVRWGSWGLLFGEAGWDWLSWVPSSVKNCWNRKSQQLRAENLWP